MTHLPSSPRAHRLNCPSLPVYANPNGACCVRMSHFRSAEFMRHGVCLGPGKVACRLRKGYCGFGETLSQQ